jgi:hypothetical protein
VPVSLPIVRARSGWEVPVAGLPWNPFAIERLDMTTALSPEECLARIRDNLYVPWPIRTTGPGLPFQGRLKGNRFTLFKRVGMWGRGSYGNSFRVMALGSVGADPSGKTLISMRIGHHIVSRLWLLLPAVGCAAALLGWLLNLVGLIRLSPHLRNPVFIPAILAFAALVFAFQYAGYLLLYGVNYVVTHDEGQFLVNMLSQILDAHTIPLRR